MPEVKERLSLLWIFALLNYLYADVIALWALLGSPPADTPPRASGARWFGGLDGNTYRDDCRLSTASRSGEPPGEYHRRHHRDPGQRFSDVHSTPCRMGTAAGFAGVLVLRNG